MKHGVKIEIEKSLTVADLKNTDHIGCTFDSGEWKAYVSWFSGKYIITTNMESYNSCNCTLIGLKFDSIKGAISDQRNRIKHLYKFDTRKELYQWLASDEN